MGVCLLHAYANPAHEELILEAFEREYPECFVSISSEVIPEPGEYERAITTLLDACIKPRIKDYVEKASKKIEDTLGGAPFMIMKSNGGVSTAPEIAKRPIGTVLSGPAAGALSAAFPRETLGPRAAHHPGRRRHLDGHRRGRGRRGQARHPAPVG